MRGELPEVVQIEKRVAERRVQEGARFVVQAELVGAYGVPVFRDSRNQPKSAPSAKAHTSITTSAYAKPPKSNGAGPVCSLRNSGP